jgi:hypothetical protein
MRDETQLNILTTLSHCSEYIFTHPLARMKLIGESIDVC